METEFNLKKEKGGKMTIQTLSRYFAIFILIFTVLGSIIFIMHEEMQFTDVVDNSELCISKIEYIDENTCIYTINKIGKDLLLLDTCNRFAVNDTIRIVKKRTVYNAF